MLHYDPETVNWDGLEAALPVMESTKAGCIRRRAHSLMRNGTMDFFLGSNGTTRNRKRIKTELQLTF